MREIKLRAWAEGENCMIYTDGVYPKSIYKFEFEVFNNFNITLMKMINRDNVYYEDGGETYIETFAPIDAKIMQYTGLKDIEDKEIYEGDIVQIYDVECGGFSESTYSIIYNTKSEWTIGDYWLLSRKHHKCKIIGNEYENTELLVKTRK